MRRLIPFLVTLPLFASPAQSILGENAVLDKMLEKQSPVYYEAVQEQRAEAQGIEEALSKDVKTVIYLTSSSVPAENLISLGYEAAMLGVKVHPVVRGLDNSIGDLAASMRSSLMSRTPGRQKLVLEAVDSIRVSPGIFKDLNVTRVPVVVVATCKGGRPYKKYCSLKTVAVGETSLEAIAKRRFGQEASAGALFKESEK